MGRKQRVVGLLLVLTESKQLLDGERRPMLVEFAAARRWRRRRRRRRRRALVMRRRQPEWPVQVGRSQDGPGTEAKRRRAGVRHRGLQSGNIVRQTRHRWRQPPLVFLCKSLFTHTIFLAAENTLQNK